MDINRTLAAGSGENIARQGNFVFVKSSTSPVRVIINGDAQLLQAGDCWTYAGIFDGLRIENTGASAIDVTLTVGAGVLTRSEVNGTVSINQGATVATNQATAGAAAAEIAAADSTRRKLTVQNIDSANTARIGGATVTAANGIRLLPGTGFTFDGSSAASVWAIRQDAADVALIVLEEKD